MWASLNSTPRLGTLQTIWNPSNTIVGIAKRESSTFGHSKSFKNHCGHRSTRSVIIRTLEILQKPLWASLNAKHPNSHTQNPSKTSWASLNAKRPNSHTRNASKTIVGIAKREASEFAHSNPSKTIVGIAEFESAKSRHSEYFSNYHGHR